MPCKTILEKPRVMGDFDEPDEAEMFSSDEHKLVELLQSIKLEKYFTVPTKSNR